MSKALHGSALHLEALAETAIRNDVAGVTVTHDGVAETFGVADFGALATALGF